MDRRGNRYSRFASKQSCLNMAECERGVILSCRGHTEHSARDVHFVRTLRRYTKWNRTRHVTTTREMAGGRLRLGAEDEHAQ
jgi:hypothetical protein